MEAEGYKKFNVDQPPPPPSTKQELESSTYNNILETDHSLIANNHNPITSSSSSSSQNPITSSSSPSSSSQNPFLVQSDATTNNITNNMDNNSSNTCVSNDSDGSRTIPSPTFELPNHEHNHTSITNNENSNLGLASHLSRESSDVGSISGGHHSASISSSQTLENGMNKGPEIQNPQVQVMERPNETNATSPYVFPSHVFARNSTNVPIEWSTASNESLFSIYMGNMSFSSELACFKSCELDKPGDAITCDQQPNASSASDQQPNASSASNQPPTPVNKFNDISQRTAELHEEGLKVTEAKAAETMREVIMENCRTMENKQDKKSSSKHHLDGSAKSYAFQTSKERDKSVSSKGAGEKQKKSEQNEKTKEGDEEAKSNTNAASTPNKWLSCFACCTFCH
ncbi:hypothetical protein KIW84_041562 [Lathyrus oleraceus]|uniref:Uncharacterized protein n=1 Tax=Pisum sativum TaxID=3888 RepID=A0A9D5ARB3_PEA|nr:hypothetical protein KIW84_041562 [Pisum sativum]